VSCFFPAAIAITTHVCRWSNNLGQSARFIWHDSHELGDVDAVILGRFSYGDYLRCGR